MNQQSASQGKTASATSFASAQFQNEANGLPETTVKTTTEMKPDDTPRTNANEHECIEAGDFVYSHFSRQLERELNEANATIGALKCHAEEMLNFIESSILGTK